MKNFILFLAIVCGVSGVCSLWHFRPAGCCSLSLGGWSPKKS